MPRPYAGNPFQLCPCILEDVHEDGRNNVMIGQTEPAIGREDRPTSSLAVRCTLYVLLVAAGVSLFSNSLSVPFWEDDFIYLRQDLDQSIDRLLGHFEPGTQTYWFYRPFVELSWSLEYLLWGKNPAGYRITNIIVHLLSTILLALILSKVIKAPFWAAFASAAVFLVHPANQCTVVWLSNRFDLFYTLFYLLSLLCFAKYLGRERKLSLYLLSLFAFVLSVLSKENAITLLGVLLLYELTIGWRKRQLLRARFTPIILRLLPFAAISAAAVLRRAIVYSSDAAFVYYRDLDSWLLAVSSLKHLKAALLPFTELNLPGFVAAFWPELLVVIAAVVLYVVTHAKTGIFLTGFVIITSLPILNQSGLRHIYLPLVGLIPLVLLSVHSMLQYLWDFPTERARRLRRYLGPIASIMLAALLTAMFLWAASIPGGGSLLPEGVSTWLIESKVWLELAFLASLAALAAIARGPKLGTMRSSPRPLFASVLLLLAVIPVFAAVTYTYNGQNAQWGESIWEIYSSLDQLKLSVKDGSEIYVENAPSRSHLTPIEFYYYPMRVYVDLGLMGFYYKHHYGDKIDPDNVFFLSSGDGGRLVREDELKYAILTRFELRRSPRMEPVRLRFRSGASASDELQNYEEVSGDIEQAHGRFELKHIDIPTTLLDSLFLSFEPPTAGEVVSGTASWEGDTTAEADAQGAALSFAGALGRGGVLQVDMSLSQRWVQTRSIASFSIEYKAKPSLKLAAIAFSSEKKEPESRLIHSIEMPKGKSWLRSPRDVIKDLLREAQ
ncbi:MAG: glycosyltransferase family 39 protein [Candidatus Coatesbacteria bacterium]|nr:glycosyltransferase family 39 protein [Candidatus Coatesbacteria bacterium]